MTRRAASRWSVVLLAVAMVASACGDDDASSTSDSSLTITTTASDSDDATNSDDTDSNNTDSNTETETDTTTTAPGGLTASWTGVTEETIRLGFIFTDFEQLTQLGFVDIDPGDPELVVNALVDDLNARGGILGRQIEPFIEYVLPVGTSSAEESCLRLVEDNEVFAVVGSFGGLAREANSCFTELSGVVQVGGSPTSADLEAATVPWLSVNMSGDRKLPALVGLFDDEGLIGSRVAVAVTASQRGLADDLVVPALNELGHEVIELAVSGSEDVGDTQDAAGEWDVFSELFAQAEIDTVVLLESIAAPGANALLSRGFDGQILIIDNTNVVGALGNTLQSIWPGADEIHGAGIETGQERIDAPSSSACIDVVLAVDPTISVIPIPDVPAGEPAWFRSIADVCGTFELFTLAATAAGPDLTPESFQTGAESLGEVALPFVGDASVGPGKWDAGNLLRISRFDPESGSEGGPVPVTDLVVID